MKGTGIAALTVIVLATVYTVVVLNTFVGALDAGARIRRLRATRLLRAVMFWELAIGLCLILLGEPTRAISVIGVAGLIAFTRWGMRRLPL